MSRYQIWSKMKKLCARAGVNAGEVFPYNLRHLFATAFYCAYKDIVKLADVRIRASKRRAFTLLRAWRSIGVSSNS